MNGKYRSTMLIMAFSIVTRLISFFFKIYLSRKVGAEVIGVFGVCISVLSLFCTLSASGVPLMLSRTTASMHAQNASKKEIGSMVSGATVFSLAIAGAIVITSLLFKRQLSIVFPDARVAKLFYVMLPALFSTIMYQIFRAYLMGKKCFFEYSLTELLEEIIKIAVCATFLSNAVIMLSQDMAIAIAFTVTDYLMMFILFIIYIIKDGSFARPRGLNTLLKTSTPVTITRIASGAISSIIAIVIPLKLVASGLTSAEASAAYGRAVGMAYSLIFAPISLTSALSIVLLPEATSLATQGKWRELRTRVNNSIIFIFIITCFFYAIFFALGKELGIILFKDAQAGEFITFSAGMCLPIALTGLINTILNSLGYERKVTRNFFIAAALLLILIFFLPKYIGIYALAVSESVFYILQFVLGFIILFKNQIVGAQIFKPSMLAMCFTFPTALFARFTFNILSSIGLFFSTLISLIVALFVYILCIYLFRPIPNISAMLFSKFKFKKTKRKTHSNNTSSKSSSHSACRIFNSRALPFRCVKQLGEKRK